jgi:acyl-CoA thioesterase I
VNEPSPVLRWAMNHFAGGDAFLFGLGLWCVLQVALVRFSSERFRRILMIASKFSVIWALAIPSPAPRWLLALFVGSLIGLWLTARKARAVSEKRVPTAVLLREGTWRWIACANALALILFEIPFRFSPSLPEPPERLQIVADSVTAGLNDGEDTWPQKLSRDSALAVVDASQPGATLKSALSQLGQLDEQNSPRSLLLLEIGGNDLLEGLPVSEFADHLERLLAAASRRERTVWMFELPMPPLSFRYGEPQRRLARQYNVRLIPRRLLLRVLTSTGGTVDGIHLSQTGHQRMAGLMRELLTLNDARSERSGNYQHVEPEMLHGSKIR